MRATSLSVSSTVKCHTHEIKLIINVADLQKQPPPALSNMKSLVISKMKEMVTPKMKEIETNWKTN